MDDSYTKLSRGAASEAVSGLGWRLVLGEFRTEGLTGSLPLAAGAAAGGGGARGRRAPVDGRARGPGDPVGTDGGDRLGDAARRGAGTADLGRGTERLPAADGIWFQAA